ncbi:MAG: tetratricopeptide repeat protein [Polyangiaceae bacterium]|nr:tetratricopeptide repeat protein [Polyangiaceae bacterium]
MRRAAIACSALTLMACGSPQSKRMQEVESTVRREQAPDKLVERGKLFAKMGDHTRAEQYFASALEQGADPRTVLPMLMRSYVESARFRSAVSVGERFLVRNPKDHALRFLVATMHSAIGQNDRAKEHLQRVVRESDGHADAHYALAVLLRDVEQDHLGADQHFRRYLELLPEGPHAAEARDSLLKALP